MEAFGKFAFTIILRTAGAFCRGWAGRLLWLWFVVPQFHLAPLSWVTAYGLCLVCAILVSTPVPEYEDDSYKARVSRSLAYGVFAPLMILGVGWLIK